MTPDDPLFARLAALPAPAPVPVLNEKLRSAAHARLRPRPVHAGVTLLVAASVVTYLGWAVHFAAGLY